MQKGTKVGYKTLVEYTDTQGWTRDDDGDYFKVIGKLKFYIFKDGKRWHLRLGQWQCGHRPSLHKCKLLAHATVRLWSGE